MRDTDLIEVAKLVRPYLPELVDEPQAASLDRSIGEILHREAAVPVRADELRELLGAADDSIVRWVEQVLESQRLLPPGLRDVEVRDGGYEPLPGAGAPIPADRFVCPVTGDVVWYRPRVSVPVPVCTTHSCQLVRD